jgi:hypothetical protein
VLFCAIRCHDLALVSYEDFNFGFFVFSSVQRIYESLLAPVLFFVELCSYGSARSVRGPIISNGPGPILFGVAFGALFAIVAYVPLVIGYMVFHSRGMFVTMWRMRKVSRWAPLTPGRWRDLGSSRVGGWDGQDCPWILPSARKMILFIWAWLIRFKWDGFRIVEEWYVSHDVDTDVRSCNSQVANLRVAGHIFGCYVCWPSKLVFGEVLYEAHMLSDLCRSFNYFEDESYDSLYRAASRYQCANIPAEIHCEVVHGSVLMYMMRRERARKDTRHFHECPVFGP